MTRVSFRDSLRGETPANCLFSLSGNLSLPRFGTDLEICLICVRRTCAGKLHTRNPRGILSKNTLAEREREGVPFENTCRILCQRRHSLFYDAEAKASFTPSFSHFVPLARVCLPSRRRDPRVIMVVDRVDRLGCKTLEDFALSLTSSTSNAIEVPRDCVRRLH